MLLKSFEFESESGQHERERERERETMSLLLKIWELELDIFLCKGREVGRSEVSERIEEKDRNYLAYAAIGLCQ